MTDTYIVTITRWFSCSSPDVFDAWAEELSDAWIEHSGLNPLIGEFHSVDHSYTFRKTVEDVASPLAAIRVVYEGVERAIAHLGPREDLRMSTALRVEIAGEDAMTEDSPANDDDQDKVGE